jgi:hypothetical protein
VVQVAGVVDLCVLIRCKVELLHSPNCCTAEHKPQCILKHCGRSAMTATKRKPVTNTVTPRGCFFSSNTHQHNRLQQTFRPNGQHACTV